MPITSTMCENQNLIHCRNVAIIISYNNKNSNKNKIMVRKAVITLYYTFANRVLLVRSTITAITSIKAVPTSCQ
jgi:hypothetical protein